MCLLKDDCIAYSVGYCPILTNSDCPDRYISFCKFCHECNWNKECKDECELEYEAIQD